MKAKTAHCATLLCRCSNEDCGHECDISELDNLETGSFELQGGEIVPDGVCPKCHSASYEINDQWDRLRASRDELLAALTEVLPLAEEALCHREQEANDGRFDGAQQAYETGVAAIDTAEAAIAKATGKAVTL